MQQKGFSLLIDLCLSMAIIAILTSIAVPSFSALIRNNQARNDLNTLLHELNFARNNAVSTRYSTLMCPSANQTHCDNNWALERMVFEDKNNNEQRDDNERILLISEGFEKQRSVKWRSFGSKPYIAFDYHGTTGFQNGRLYWCDNKQEEKQQLIIYKTGRVRKAQGQFLFDSCG